MPRKNLHSEIARVAHEIYVQRSYEHGHDLDHWLEAERIVISNQAVKPKKKDKMVKTLKTSPAKKITKTSNKKTETKKTPKPTEAENIKEL